MGKITIRRVHYNNKSRQGYYYYIKETGKKPRVLKAQPGLNKEFYQYAHEHNIGWRALKNASKIFQETKKKHKITLRSTLSTGMTETTIELGKLTNEHTRNQVYDRLLKPLLKGITDQHLKRLVQQNIRHHTNKFSYLITGYNNKGGVAIEIKDIGTKNLEQISHTYAQELGLLPGHIVSNSLDYPTLIANKAGISNNNIKVRQTGERLISVRVRIRFTQ